MTDLKSTLPVPEEFTAEYLEHWGILPLALADGRLIVATVGNAPEEVLQDLAASYMAEVDQILVEREDLSAAIRQAFTSRESVVELVRDLGTVALDSSSEQVPDLSDIRSMANQAPVVRFVNLLIREAHASSASDIHLEATRDGLRVRLRIDGVLAELPGPPQHLQSAVISRAKLLADLDIAEQRKPQDGRVRVRLETTELDLRVATTPTLFGESVVLRLLDHGGRPVTLKELGMQSDMLLRFEALSSRAHGIVLATGPTGSGKTTTLYAALTLRSITEEKIITVEDPVEYHLPGITQVPVHVRSGVTFAVALRSILRHDPDVMMVGEMRDHETAGIAVQAAMTGHLVFSTLHTNDAVSALTRLVDLKIEPYMVAASVEGVLAQRLVRRVCPDCHTTYVPDGRSLSLVTERPVAEARAKRFVRGAGCARCRDTGYRGRIGLFQLLEMTDGLRECLAGPLHLGRLREEAARSGLRTLRHDGWAKVEAGLTTVEEVLRVTGV